MAEYTHTWHSYLLSSYIPQKLSVTLEAYKK